MNKSTIVFASNNVHKLAELRELADGKFNILSLSDIGCVEDIPETAPTISGNALMKAQYVFDKYGYDCFADDTGLIVDALGGEPGVYSARYAGPGHDSQANMKKLLANMEGVTDRRAYFMTVIALVSRGNDAKLFEGRVDGVITTEPQGEGGFGYDPIFLPDESDVTFAQMSGVEKNAISHRGRAVKKLFEYLSR